MEQEKIKELVTNNPNVVKFLAQIVKGQPETIIPMINDQLNERGLKLSYEPDDQSNMPKSNQNKLQDQKSDDEQRGQLAQLNSYIKNNWHQIFYELMNEDKDFRQEISQIIREEYQGYRDVRRIANAFQRNNIPWLRQYFEKMLRDPEANKDATEQKKDATNHKKNIKLSTQLEPHLHSIAKNNINKNKRKIIKEKIDEFRKRHQNSSKQYATRLAVIQFLLMVEHAQYN